MALLSHALLVATALAVAPAPATDATFLTKEEALALAFPECTVTKDTVTLTKEELERVCDLADRDQEDRLVLTYVATTKEGQAAGRAYFDAHRVRTMREALMVAVGPDGRVARIEVLAFAEPRDYLPRASWYGQFTGRVLNDALSLKGEIRGVTGATLTAEATTAAVRRMLAVEKVLREREKEEPSRADGGG